MNLTKIGCFWMASRQKSVSNEGSIVGIALDAVAGRKGDRRLSHFAKAMFAIDEYGNYGAQRDDTFFLGLLQSLFWHVSRTVGSAARSDGSHFKLPSVGRMTI